jgi:hypothetical protein
MRAVYKTVRLSVGLDQNCTPAPPSPSPIATMFNTLTLSFWTDYFSLFRPKNKQEIVGELQAVYYHHRSRQMTPTSYRILVARPDDRRQPRMGDTSLG